MADIKIFNMDGNNWYAAETVDGALKALAVDQGANLGGIPEERWVAWALEICLEGGPAELSDADLDRLMYVEECDEPPTYRKSDRTFREQLAVMIDAGETFPCSFAARYF